MTYDEFEAGIDRVAAEVATAAGVAIHHVLREALAAPGRHHGVSEMSPVTVRESVIATADDGTGKVVVVVEVDDVVVLDEFSVEAALVPPSEAPASSSETIPSSAIRTHSSASQGTLDSPHPQIVASCPGNRGHGAERSLTLG